MLIIIYNVYLTLKQNFYYRHSTLRDRLIISNKTKIMFIQHEYKVSTVLQFYLKTPI